MCGEHRPGCRDLLYVGMQVALGGGQGSVAGDASQDVYLDSGVGEPGRSRVPEVVAAQVLVAEFGDHVVPVGGVAQGGGGDASAAWAGEQPRGPVNRRASGFRPAARTRWATRGRISSPLGTLRARFPLVPLSVSPPGSDRTDLDMDRPRRERTAYLMSMLIRRLLEKGPASSWSIQQSLHRAEDPGSETVTRRRSRVVRDRPGPFRSARAPSSAGRARRRGGGARRRPPPAVVTPHERRTPKQFVRGSVRRVHSAITVMRGGPQRSSPPPSRDLSGERVPQT